jgi:hypothetical protein
VSGGARVVIGVLVVAAIAGAYVWSRQRPAPPPPIAAPVPEPAPPRRAPPDAAPEPAIKHPIEAGGGKGLPGLDDADGYVRNALGELLGRKALSLLALDGFVRRFVATVDNLGREAAPARLWPVNPTAGVFKAEADAGGAIAAQNAQRYAPLAALAEAVETRRAVALYVRLYPLFQQAYEELGYPGKYFNDRLVEVIDDLLATPEVTGPIKVRAVKASAPGVPTLYQFEDPALEALPAGRKILLRVGADNARRFKAKLAEVRGQIVRKPLPSSRR